MKENINIQKMLLPAIKWIGSKRTQANEICKYIKKDYNIYYEPFCGGASMLFYIINNIPDKFKGFVCSDINNDLINVFNLIKTDVNFLIFEYKNMWNELNKDEEIKRKKEYFRQIREEYNKNKRPEHFLFIMRTTTNGMPRYNKKGEFNNTYHVNRNGIDPDNFKKILFNWNYFLNKYNVQFVCECYQNINPNSSDFCYFDPPYFNTKEMYNGNIDNSLFFEKLRRLSCDYIFSYDGISGENNQIYNVPKDVYSENILLHNHNSSFKRIKKTDNASTVYEGLYLKIK